MRFKLLFVVSLFMLFGMILFSAVVNAQEEHFQLSELLNSTDKLNTALQENEVIIPNALGFIIKEGNISLNLSMNNGDVESFYVVIDGKRVTMIEKGFPEKSNYDIFTDEETLNEILASDDISKGILSAYNNSMIKIKANGFGNKIKLFFGKILLKFFT